MAIFLSKFLPLLVYPLGFSILLLFVSLILSKRSSLRILLQVFALLILLVFSNRWVALSLVRSLESRTPPLTSTPKADVIVLLGGATEPPLAPRLTPEVNSAADRLFYAASLYHSGAASALILSGGNITWLESGQTTPAQDMASLLVTLGVPREALILEGESQNTEENALNAAEIIRKNGYSSVILVTSAMHMPRALKLFEAQGQAVIPAPCDFTYTSEGFADLSASPSAIAVNLMPNAGSLSLSTAALKEYFGMLFIDLRP